MTVRVDVFTSGIWQTTTTVIAHAGACVVIDPAYFPRELAAIADHVGAVGPPAAVVFTHGHWDHVMGHAVFPAAPVVVSHVLDRAIAGGDPRAARYLEDAREFDSRWYVPRPDGHRWPAARRPVRGGESLSLAGVALRALDLPGHSPEGLGLVVEADGLLLCGDYLSPCEIPFVEDAAAYRSTLLGLLDLLAGEVGAVIPGHGPRLTAAEATEIARADLGYVEQLLAAAERGDAAAARDVALPRAADVVGMADHHRDNCAKLGLAVAVARVDDVDTVPS